MRNLAVSVFLLILLTSQAQADFIRGDLDADGQVTQEDYFILKYGWLELKEEAELINTWGSPPVQPPDYAYYRRQVLGCPDKADINDDGTVDRDDLTYLAAHLVGRIQQLPAPFPFPGSDPTVDQFGCGACFFAGFEADGTAWVKMLHPSATGNYDQLVDIVAASGDEMGWLRGIAIIDATTLVVIGYHRTNYTPGVFKITLGGLNQIIHLFDGFIPHPTIPDESILNQAMCEIAVDNGGHLVILDHYVWIPPAHSPWHGSFLSTLSTAGQVLGAPLVPPGSPVSLRIDAQSRKVFNSSGNFASHIYQGLGDGSIIEVCDIPRGYIKDLHPDRLDVTGNRYFYAVRDTVNPDFLEGVSVCDVQSGTALWVDERELGLPASASDVVKQIEQFPGYNNDLLIALEDGRVFRASSTDINDLPTLVATLPSSMQDVVCMPDE